MALGNSAGISFSGLASGIDTASIVSQLVALERLPIQRLQQRQALLETQKSAYSQFRSQLQSLSSSLGSLNAPNAFSSTKATSSDTAAVSVTAGSSALEGVYDLVVSRLATAEKVSSTAQTDATSPMNFSGSFVVNGKTIEVEATDTLADVAAAINGADAGVTASIINGGTGKTFLTLTAKETGADNHIKLEDTYQTPVPGQPSILSALGLKAGFKSPITNGFVSGGVADSKAALNTQLDFGSQTSFTIKIKGQSHTFDVSTATLDDVRQAFEDEGLTASVESFDDNGTPKERLNVTGLQAQELDDPDHLLEKIGVFKSPSRLVEAADAEYSVDGIDFTSSTNKIENVIQGATLNLLKADSENTVRIAVEKDASAAVNLVKGVVTAYNNAMKFITDNSAFNNETFQSGIFFGDSLTSQIQSTLSSTIFGQQSLLDGAFKNITQVGLSLDSDGRLSLDEAALTTAITNDPTSVAQLFASTGTASSSGITYVSSSSKTRPSDAAGYAINITKIATKASATGSVAPTSNNAGGESLTFKGQGFDTAGYTINISAGSSINDVVSQINSDSKLNGRMVASIVDGKLKIESKRYGAANDFTVTSNLAAAANNTGIGTFGQATVVAGADVEGTINGTAATGSGQFLLSSTGDSEGLQIQYTGTTTGAVGTLKFTAGIGGSMLKDLDSFMNSQSGLIKTSFDSLDAQISDLTDQIDRVNQRATAKETTLKARFLAMEQAMQAAQSQLQRMQAITARSN